jgi:hypothetical protein
MMDSSQALLDDAIEEILRREPLYLSRFPIGFSTIEAQVSRYLRDPVLCRRSPSKIAQTLREAIAYYVDRGVRLNETASDPVGDMLLDSAMSALDPGWEAASSKSTPSSGADLMGALNDAYQEHRTETGFRYFIRYEGTRPLVLVNAIGAPLIPIGLSGPVIFGAVASVGSFSTAFIAVAAITLIGSIIAAPRRYSALPG